MSEMEKRPAGGAQGPEGRADEEPEASASADDRAGADDRAEGDPGAEGEGAGRDEGAGEDGEGEDEEGEDEEDEEDDGEQAAEPPLLPPGNAPRFVRGPIAILIGVFSVFCLMAVKAQLRFGVPLGALGVLVATFGVLDLLGSFDDPDDRVAGRARLRDLARPLGVTAAGVVALWAVISLAVEGRLSQSHPVLAAGVLVPATFLTLVTGLYQLGDAFGMWAKGEDGAPLPMIRRHGFWLVLATTLLYLPTLGSHSLSDPWETHYGEVAREILSRNDWISTWWAQDGWFFSKPVLDFWIQALAMSTFGVRYHADRMLSAVSEGREPWPEWAVRLPNFLLTLLAVYLLYKAVSRAFGRRAGLLGGLVLLTMPQWFILAHQTMTDMPFVAPMASAMALVLLGAHEDPEAPVRVYELDLGVGKLRLSAFHLVLGAVTACALPQILYLFSRNVLLDIRGFHVIVDQFFTGSPGNCGLPGNDTCRSAIPALRGLHPALQALIWAQALALVLYMSWGERRRQRLYFLAAWLFAAVATMGKGPAGIGLPALCALAYIVVTRRFRDLARMEITAGFLILLCVALPWFVAMYARHGQPFTDRLIFHDMVKRAFTHVHDTNEGDDVSFRFYVWQLGYAMFPWTGVVPAALLLWLRKGEGDTGERRGDASIFLAMWFILAFALFSAMPTKFHHYIFPAVPPAAMLVGVLLDALLGRASPEPIADPTRAFKARFDRLMIGVAAAAGATLVFAVGRDLSAVQEGLPNQIRLMHLVTYNYRRPWPPSLSFNTTLWAFTAAATVITLLLAVVSIRRRVVVALVALGLAFAAWGLDVYFMKISPHWGQRETTLAYYKARREIPGPLVAYQMNWKGENFYTGNHIPAFVSSGKKFQDYVLDQKKKGVRTFYFVTEHGRTTTLSNELGHTSSFEKLTTPELDNKFVLVRARFE